MAALQNQKTDNGKSNYKNLIKFPHPITAFITVLDPWGNAALTKLLACRGSQQD